MTRITTRAERDAAARNTASHEAHDRKAKVLTKPSRNRSAEAAHERRAARRFMEEERVAREATAAPKDPEVG